MNQQLKAVYRNGGFFTLQPCDLPEDCEVSLLVQGPSKRLPEIKERGEVARVLKMVTERMIQNRLPPQAPRFAREDLHGRP